MKYLVTGGAGFIGSNLVDELVRRGLAAWKDPREVMADAQARYYGIRVSERTLLPGDDARLGETRFEAWLAQASAKKAAG